MQNSASRRFLLAVAMALGLLASVRDARAAAFARAPYVQSVTATEAVVAFHTDAACPATVRFGPDDARAHAAVSEETATKHAVRLTGLPADSEIRYSVEACGQPVGDVQSFRTAPAAGARSVRFAALGDFGTGSDIQRNLGEAILAAKPALMLGLGDIAYDSGTASELEERFFRPMAPLFSRVPIYVALGNHEYVTDDAKPTLDALHLPANNARGTERYYSFDWGPVHFVALDAMCAMNLGSGAGCDPEEQKAWLREDLAKTRAPWKIAFWHHPAYTSSPKDSVEMREEILPILEAAGVDLTFTGHAHNYERSRPVRAGAVDEQNGIVHVVAGFGSARLKYFDDEASAPWWSAFRDNQNFGWVDVSVDGGRLTATARTLDGGTLDTFTLEKPLAPGAIAPGGGPSSGDPNAPSFLDPDDPGAELPGGCAAAGAGTLGLVGLLALLVRRRRA